MRYSISTQLDHHPANVQTRQRRDAAELAFRKAVYGALRANGLLDQQIARRVMGEADAASNPKCDSLEIRVRETVVAFRRAA